MSDYAIRAERLGKRYAIGERLRYRTLRDAIAGTGKRTWDRIRQGMRARSNGTAFEDEDSSRYIWAVKDVSFDVQAGEVVGIIGPNGAGKSTLLKILSRITEPTLGRAEISGRIGSLLEVGTGFHPELTGRENIFLNGAILGMKRMEIGRKFDEIVDFSGIERFIDTPVKRYSSGMYTRLAFAVAAHLEPEILLVDEVLAVGDAEFQKKCLGKMTDVAREGRTVIFVSHNLLAVQSLCHRVIWIDGGRAIEQGSPRDVISRYVRTAYSAAPQRVWDELDHAPGTRGVRLRSAHACPTDPAYDRLNVRTPFQIEFEYEIREPDTHVYASIYLYNEHGVLLFNSGPAYTNRPAAQGRYRERCFIPGDLLNNGMHRVMLEFVIDRWQVYRVEEMLLFDVEDTDDMRGSWFGTWEGALRPILAWQTEHVEEPIPSALGRR